MFVCIKNGWGNWIRTSEMADSESVAPYRLAIPQKKMAGVTGFRTSEMADSESLCLTAWLYPSNLYYTYIFRRCKEKK